MNNARRKTLRDIIMTFGTLVDIQALEDLKGEVEQARDDEQDYLDNMPESLQGGDKGQAAEAAVSALESAIEALETAIDALGEVEGHVEEAAQ